MKAQKTVTVLARVEFKSDSKKVCYLVRASNGVDQYETCLYHGKACSCSCKARTRCKHMDAVEAKEQERTRNAALAAAQEASKDELARIERETLASIAAETLKSKYDVRTSVPDANQSTFATNMVIEAKRRQEAPLAGASRAFSLFR